MKHYLGLQLERLFILLQPDAIELPTMLMKFCGSGESLVDLGCGNGNHWGRFSPSHTTRIGVDSYRNVTPRANLFSRDIVNESMISFLVNSKPREYSHVLASCVLEHLPKSEGYTLLSEMKRVCAVSAVVFTPNGFVPQPPDSDNPANEHLSGWTPKELIRFGFVPMAGINGLRYLRSSFAIPTVKPLWLGELISKFTGRIASRFPRIAYQILYVYEVPC